MAPSQCPLCGSKLQPDWEACPNCPMSFLDAPPEKSALQNDNFRSFGVPLLLFGGLIYVVWSAGQFMWRTAEAGTETVSTIATTVTGPTLAKGGGVVPSDSRAIQGLVNEQVTGTFDPSGDAPPTPADIAQAAKKDEGPGTISIMAYNGPKDKVVLEWKMRGYVYDLITLAPVPGVHMIFTDNVTNSRAQIVTDAQGRYRTILPALPDRGYLVSLSKTGYQKSYLNPGTEGVSEMPLKERKVLAQELASLIAEPASLQPNSDSPLVTDFHLAPK